MAKGSKSSAGKNFTVILLFLVIAAGVVAFTLLSGGNTSDLEPTDGDTQQVSDDKNNFSGSGTAVGSYEEVMLDSLGTFVTVEESDGYTFEVYERAVVMAKCDKTDEKIVIPGEYNGKPVVCIGEFGTRSGNDGYTTRRRGFMGNSVTKEIVVPDSVVVTGDMCFAEMDSLEKLTLPNTLKYYVASALGTPWFEKLSDEFCLVGDGILIKYNGEGGDVRIPSGTKVISSWAMTSGVYTSCPDITALTLPSTVEYICDDAIKVSYGLKSLTLPDSLKYIGSRGIDAGSAVAELESINVGTSLKYANSDSFGFNGMMPAQWTDKFTVIGDGVLINYNGTGGTVTVPDGVKVVACSFGGASKVILPNSVLYAGDGAFTGVSEVSLPDSLKIVGKYAFKDSAVASLTLPASVKYVGFGAFKDSAGLSSITMPCVVNISSCAFSGCMVLSEAECGGSVEYIGQRAFANSGLDKINIPTCTKYVDDEAFADCYSLNFLNIYGFETQIGENLILGDTEAVIYCTRGSAVNNALKKDATIKFVAE